MINRMRTVPCPGCKEDVPATNTWRSCQNPDCRELLTPVREKGEVVAFEKWPVLSDTDWEKILSGGAYVFVQETPGLFTVRRKENNS